MDGTRTYEGNTKQGSDLSGMRDEAEDQRFGPEDQS
jgi:hypothetical protein